METKAYAKINLTLDITGRDERGYHLLSSLFAEISLADTVVVTEGGNGITLSCNLPYVPVDDRNLCYKAAQNFLREFSLSGDFHIDLTKRIPVCSGLGGGSSDAAAVLRLLCAHFGIDVTSARVLRVAANIGADVPFFLQGGLCLAEGIGERLTPLPRLEGYTVVLVKTAERASTPDVYRTYDSCSRKNTFTTPSFLEALRNGKDVAPYVSNHLADAASVLCPSVPVLKKQLLALGADAAEMSGSGSAVYGLFRDAEKAKTAAKNIKTQFCEVCHFT